MSSKVAEIVDASPEHLGLDEDTIKIELTRDEDADADAPTPRPRDVTTMTALSALTRNYRAWRSKHPGSAPGLWLLLVALGGGGATLAITSPWDDPELQEQIRRNAEADAEILERLDQLEAVAPAEIGKIPERLEALEKARSEDDERRKAEAEAEAKRERELAAMRQALVRLSARGVAEQRYLSAVTNAWMDAAGIPAIDRPPIPKELREAEDAATYQKHERWLFGDTPP